MILLLIVKRKNPYTEHKIDVLDRLNQDLVIGSDLKDKKSLEQYFYNLVIKEYLKIMDK